MFGSVPRKDLSLHTVHRCPKQRMLCNVCVARMEELGSPLVFVRTPRVLRSPPLKRIHLPDWLLTANEVSRKIAAFFSTGRCLSYVSIPSRGRALVAKPKSFSKTPRALYNPCRACLLACRNWWSGWTTTILSRLCSRGTRS